MYPSNMDDKQFKERIKEEMKSFFERNKTQDISIQSVWKSSKAYLRGMIIQQCIRKSRVRNSKYKNFIIQLKNEEDRAKRKKESQQQIMKIKELQHELNNLLTEEMARKIQQVKQKYFESANKTGK